MAVQQNDSEDACGGVTNVVFPICTTVSITDL